MDGTLADYADAADRFGITRARICQIVSLTLLSPEIQEAILAGEVAVCERELRYVVSEAGWERQGRLSRRTPHDTARRAPRISAFHDPRQRAGFGGRPLPS